MAAWEEGNQKALMITTERREDPKASDSVAILFPTYDGVCSQYNRHKKTALFSVTDPFDLPVGFRLTLRGYSQYAKKKKSASEAVEEQEQWLLEANEDAGVVIFSSDDDLRAAAKCKYLQADGTYDVCPREFKQLFSIHGYVLFYFCC
jgi:hypothetical protein